MYIVLVVVGLHIEVTMLLSFIQWCVWEAW